MELFNNNYTILFFHFRPTLGHLHPLQGENCDRNSRLVVDGDANGEFGLERDKAASRYNNYYLHLKSDLYRLEILILPPQKNSKKDD